MLGWRVAVLLCLFGALVACQSPTPGSARSGTAPERAPGWVEFVVRDPSISADPRVPDFASAPSCQLKVLLDRKSVMSTTLHPSGDAPPYSLAFRFRIRAVAGGYTATFRYSGCNEEHESNDVVAKAPLLVLSDGVTQVIFDGAAVSTRPPTMLSGPPGWQR